MGSRAIFTILCVYIYYYVGIPFVPAEHFITVLLEGAWVRVEWVGLDVVAMRQPSAT